MTRTEEVKQNFIEVVETGFADDVRNEVLYDISVTLAMIYDLMKDEKEHTI